MAIPGEIGCAETKQTDMRAGSDMVIDLLISMSNKDDNDEVNYALRRPLGCIVYVGRYSVLCMSLQGMMLPK